MGGFYGSVHVRGVDPQPVREALEWLHRKHKTRFLLGPSLNGWIGIYPDGHGQDTAPARAVARRLAAEVIAMVSHDEDIFVYEYYSGGKRVDQFNSAPESLGMVSEKEKRKQRGKPQTFAHLAADPERFSALCERLAGPSSELPDFESELMSEFADALGIRNAVTCYEYLKEDDGDGIEGWEQFVHIPDETHELARKRQKDAAVLEEKRRLTREGRLLAERGGFRRWGGPHPWCVPWPGGGGFLVVWSSMGDPVDDTRPVERHGSPWSAGPAATPWAIGPRIYDLAASSSGRYIATAVVHRGITVWDLQENRLVTADSRGMKCLSFTADEAALVGIADRDDMAQVVITPIDGQTPRALPVSRAVLAAAHPSGSALVVVDLFRRLLVVDVASGRVLRTHFVGGRYVPTPSERTLTTQLQESWANVDADTLIQQLETQFPAIRKGFERAAATIGQNAADAVKDGKRQFEERVRAMCEHFASPAHWVQEERGCDQALAIKFDAAGNRLFVATDSGAQVYAWEEMLAAPDGALCPARAVQVSGSVVDRGQGPMYRQGWIYDLVHDPDCDRLLFGGLDGHLRFLDLDSGNSGVLLAPPGLPPIRGVILSRDRATLCLIADPDFLVHGPNLRGPVLQFWDYQAISQGRPETGGPRLWTG